MRLRFLSLLAMFAVLFGAGESRGQNLRAPSVPLVAVDPYYSIWSPADRLTDAATVHWTGAPNRLTSLVRIDGKVYRVMGNEPASVPALEQTKLEILPTTVNYTFEGAGVRVGLSFLTPLLPEDLMVFSRPVTYLTWDVRATDGKSHDVQVYYDQTAELVVNDAKTQEVTWGTERFGNVQALKAGSAEQPVLGRKGDGVRIDWGYAYVAAPSSQKATMRIAPAEAARNAWTSAPAAPAPKMPVVAADAPVLSAMFNLGAVQAQSVSRYLILAYDDIRSVQYFKQDLKGYWAKDGDTIGDLLKTSAAEYESLVRRAAAFDKELMSDLEKVGGPKYAWIGALSYRQSLAASKVVADPKGQPLYFCKENTSNGCMGTVDVFFPQAPLPLFISPSLSKAMLVPILEYASSGRWKFPFAPHDVGTWPLGNGQVYGGGERTEENQMPVEESGNMLLLVAAISQMDGNADFASKYWPALTRWAAFLEQYGRDPENQLSTDDFSGHLAHNANLAAKAIVALGAYGKMAGMRGDKATADRYMNMAREYVQGWVKQADDGDHFRLAFDQPGSWSTKYNLVWDKLLGLNLFPDEVLRKEVDFYRTVIEPYGLPLDGRLQRADGGRRARWTKTDWAFWAASLTGDKKDFEAITDPIYRYYAETPRRVGLADLYFTDQPVEARMHSRPVMGGIFIKMLYDQALWKKWAARDQSKLAGTWAPIPPKPPEPITTTVVAPGTITWRYTTDNPADGWFQKAFDDQAWKTATGGLGTKGTPNADVKNEWNTANIWLRGEVTIPAGNYTDLQLFMYHDEDAVVYIDGKLATRASGFTTNHELYPINRAARLKPGKHVIAVHVRQTGGGQFIDLGISDVKPGK